MAKRKLISTPPGTTAVLWKKNTYLVGQEVPDDFPDDKLQYTAPAGEAGAAEGASDQGGDDTAEKGKKKRGKKAAK